MKFEKRLITSYGLLSANSFYCKPETEEQLHECLVYAKQKHLQICPYGSGMSFSDVCLIKNNISLDITALNRIISFNELTGIIIVQAGVLTTDILSLVMPLGWYLCGLSGSLKNTVAGDLSNNVHGKDSWKYGNFGANVISMKIFLADGTISETSPTHNSELFNAVIGGMGLLGVVVEVTLQLIKIPSYMIESRSKRTSDFKSMIKTMENLSEKEISFCYAWTDAFSQNSSFGRSIVESAEFIENINNCSQQQFSKGLTEKKRIGFLPPAYFWKLFSIVESQTMFKVVNQLKYYSLANESRSQKTFPEYQYPMVKHFPRWNLKYVPKGFHEIQPLFSIENFEPAFIKMMEICRQYRCLPQICSIRKHKAEPYYLSFSASGISFTINYPLKTFSHETAQELCRKLIAVVLHYKGKIYLGKFPFITASECREMYPAYDKFLQIKNIVDSNKLFASEASLRLFE